MKAILIALLGIFVVGIVAVSTYAFGGFRGSEDMRRALESGDYDAYVSAAEAGGCPVMATRMSEDRFLRKAEKYSMMQNIRDALDANDYESWKSAMENSAMGKAPLGVNSENWDKYVELHNARQSGDYELAAALSQELGIEGFQGRRGLDHDKRGFGRGFGKQDFDKHPKFSVER